MPRTAVIVLAASCIAYISFVAAIPSFEGITSWFDIGSLVPGMSYLEALGPKTPNDVHIPFYVSIQAPRGYPGNATIYRNKSPPLFYIHQNQLWHYHNDSTILPMNVHNSTGSPQLPLQLMVGKTRDVVTGGKWRWQGTMLFYEHGSQTNQGLFYSCQDTTGLMGLFLFLQWSVSFIILFGAPLRRFVASSAPPPGCTPFTIHSFSSIRR
ncbi:hypothetical protein A0H81_09886, partial [Grifola frondosa]